MSNVPPPVLLGPCLLGPGNQESQPCDSGGPATFPDLSFLILSLDGHGKSDNWCHDHEELEAQSGSGNGKQVTGLGDSGPED